MSHVFICYAHKDQDFVEHLVVSLRRSGINVWIDKSGLKPSTPDWEAAVRGAIEDAQAVLLVASPDSQRSLYVRDELTIARQKGKPIYPVWASGKDYADCIPIGHGSTQFVDLRGFCWRA